MTEPPLRDTVVKLIHPSGDDADCRITCVVLRPHGRYAMLATLPDRPAVDVEAGDCFEALRLIHSELEADDIYLQCAGACRDVWSSGMQRDMGMGLKAYVLTLPRTSRRPAVVDIFAPAPPDLIGTVAEQEQAFRAWAASSRQD